MIKPLTFLCAFLIAILLPGVFPSGQPSAQETERVAAVVNDDVVTMRDLDERIRVALLSSGLPDTQESRSRVAQQVLRRLIDEHLELQEADRLKISVSPSEIANGIATIERQNKMPANSFEPMLKSHDIDPDTVRQQVKAEIAWVRVIRAQLLPSLHIGEEEIDSRLAIIKENHGKPEYLGAEIFLAVDDPQREEQIKALAGKLLDQMRQGIPFSILARQFSQSGAASGGDLGWVSEGMLDNELYSALTQLHVGQVTPPIRLSDGYHILLLRQKRISGESEGTEPTVDMAAINLINLPNATSADRAEQVSALRNAVKKARTCDQYEMASKKVATADWNRPGPVMIPQLPPDLATIASQLSVGQMSEPVEKPNVTRFFVMCARTEGSNGMPSRDEVKHRIEDERMDLMAQRYLRDLRRSAFVEIRF